MVFSVFFVFPKAMQHHIKGVKGKLIILLQIYRSLQQRQKFTNASRIDKVFATVRVAHFLRHGWHGGCRYLPVWKQWVQIVGCSTRRRNMRRWCLRNTIAHVVRQPSAAAVRQWPQPPAAVAAAADVAGAELLWRIVEFHIPAVEHTQQAAVRKEPVLLLVETVDPEVYTVTAVDIAEIPVLDMVSALGQDTEWLLLYQ